MMGKKLLTRNVIIRSAGLMDMLYTPAEIAKELGISKHNLYHGLIQLGLPHDKDKDGHLWMHGPEVARWIREQSKGKHHALADDEAYCLRCRAVVPLQEARRIRRGRFLLLQGTCPTCGATVNKGTKKHDKQE